MFITAHKQSIIYIVNQKLIKKKILFCIRYNVNCKVKIQRLEDIDFLTSRVHSNDAARLKKQKVTAQKDKPPGRKLITKTLKKISHTTSTRKIESKHG